jgi:hypothetical protein
MPFPKRERLSEALQRVMGTSGSEKQAKRDLCNALADRKIRLRLCFMWRPTTHRRRASSKSRILQRVRMVARAG